MGFSGVGRERQGYYKHSYTDLFLDTFTATSGEKTYGSAPSGKSLKAVYCLQPNATDVMHDIPTPTITISGTTISWSNLYTGLGSFIYTFWG